MIISKSKLRDFFENYNLKQIVNSNELLMYDKDISLEKLQKLREKYNKNTKKPQKNQKN